jgi:hypothetical protein
MRSTFVCAGLVLAVVGFAPPANATPITYELSGTASGKIGGTTFTNALVELTGTGDTAGVVSFADGTFANTFDKLTVSIDGVGTATATVPTEILSIPFVVLGDPEIPPVLLVIFGRTDSPPALDGITGLGALGSFALTGYELTAIGPITDLGGLGFPVLCGTPGHDPCMQTSLGFLSFTTNDIFTDEKATFTATTVPEPATVLLVSGGLAAIVRRSRSRKRG